LAAIATLAGMVSDGLLLLRETTMELMAGLFNDTVQVLDAMLPRADGVQTSEESCGGALAARLNV
jgi:hypothetical protein